MPALEQVGGGVDHHLGAGPHLAAQDLAGDLRPRLDPASRDLSLAPSRNDHGPLHGGVTVEEGVLDGEILAGVRVAATTLW